MLNQEMRPQFQAQLGSLQVCRRIPPSVQVQSGILGSGDAETENVTTASASGATAFESEVTASASGVTTRQIHVSQPGNCKMRSNIMNKVTVTTPSRAAPYRRRLCPAEGKIARALLGGNAGSISRLLCQWNP